MQMFGVYTVYLHHNVLRAVLRAVVVREVDANLLAEKWGCIVKPVKATVE